MSNYYLRPAQLCHHETKLIFNEMIMRSAFFYAKTISWIFMVLPHRKNMSPHPDTLCSFRANQCFLVHLNLPFLAKKQHIRMCLVFCFTRVWFEPTTYLTRSDQTNHYTPDAVYFLIFYLNLLRYNCKHISIILERRV